MIKRVVALSGGKDSTAMAVRLTELYPHEDFIYVCTPTGDESPEMFEHWRMLGKILGKPLLPIVRRSLAGLIREQNALPNWRQRWCTRMLKIEPYAEYLLSLASQGYEVVSYVGLRADEPEREGGDYTDIPGVRMEYPMRDWEWTINEVLSYLYIKSIVIPKRTDCLKCFFQRLIEWYEYWKNYPAEWAEGEALEELTGYTFRSPGRDTWPASMKGLRELFEQGKIPRDTRRDALKDMQCRVCRI